MSLDDLLAERDVVICIGSGGVGKTTTAAALAIAAARAGRNVVVLTVDPARRLADALGLGAASPKGADEAPAAGSSEDTSARLGRGSGLGNDPRRIEGPWAGELWAVMLDPAITFDNLIREHAADPAQAAAVLANRLYQNLTSSLSGTHEYMAAERLLSLHLDPRFDLVVVDTPPSQHALDLLDSPSRLTRFIDHRLYRSILAPRRGLMKAVSSATQLVIRTISQVVGAALLTDVVDFFAAFEGMDEGFRQRAADVDRVLRGPDATYVAVTAPRHESLREARWLIGRLHERGRRADAVVVNRLTPDFLGGADATDLGGTDADPLAQNLRDLAALRRSEEALVTDLDADTIVLIDEQPEPVTDVASLEALAVQLGEA